MKKLSAILLVVCLALLACPALAKSAMPEEDYALYYEIIEYLCDDWTSSYDELIDQLAEYYGVSADEIFDFIDYAMENDREHVWIPVHGGKKFHTKYTCSSMIEPRPCTRDMAADFGFDYCKRCAAP